MPEAKNTNTDMMSSTSVTAVMPCVGGLIFWVAKNSIETEIERQEKKQSNNAGLRRKPTREYGE